MRNSGRRWTDQRGTVTAETALVLPALVLVVLALVWLVAAAIAQVRVVDAARDAARAYARGDDRQEVVSAARRVAGPGSRVDVAADGGLVEVTVSDRVAAPGWLLIRLPAIVVHGRAVTEAEDRDDAG